MPLPVYSVVRKQMMALGTVLWLKLPVGRVPAAQSSCITEHLVTNLALGVSGGQRSRRSKHSPKAGPVCLQDMSICPDVRVEDMGHKQGCNGVDNGKLWFYREFCMLHMALGASLDGPAAAERLPGCSGAQQQGHLQLLEVRPGGASTSVCVRCAPAAALTPPAVQRPASARDLLRCRCQDSQDSPTQRLVKC